MPVPPYVRPGQTRAYNITAPIVAPAVRDARMQQDALTRETQLEFLRMLGALLGPQQLQGFPIDLVREALGNGRPNSR